MSSTAPTPPVLTPERIAELRALQATSEIWTAAHPFSSAYSDERAMFASALEEDADMLLAAASRLAEVEAENAELRAALKPFAELQMAIGDYDGRQVSRHTIADGRIAAARKALARPLPDRQGQ